MLTDGPVIPVLLATDLDESKRFYTERLGLTIGTESDSTITFEWAGEPRLRLSKSTEGTKDSQTKVGFIVTDLRAEVDALRARGVEFEEYDTDELRTEDGIADQGEALVAWVTDPGGNVLGVEQPK